MIRSVVLKVLERLRGWKDVFGEGEVVDCELRFYGIKDRKFRVGTDYELP